MRFYNWKLKTKVYQKATKNGMRLSNCDNIGYSNE